MIKLKPELFQVGTKGTVHRYGWPYVMQHLKAHHHENGLLLDDFVDRTFIYEPLQPTWTEPWVGIFHHPPHMPRWFGVQDSSVEALFESPRFQISRKFLKGGIALSRHSANYLQKRLQIPFLVLKHPTELPLKTFNAQRFLESNPKKIVQVGWYLRNYRAIYQLPLPPSYLKIHLCPDTPWQKLVQAKIDQHSPTSSRRDFGKTARIQRLDDEHYDTLLSQSLVFVEYFTASASNTVIECIARNAPIVVNRLPALEEYLGANYPLFYDDLDQVADLITNENVAAAHRHLVQLDKAEFKINSFVDPLLEFVKDVWNS